MSKYYKRLDNLSDIPDETYTGYIWMSNNPAPTKVTKKSELPVTRNPYIVEANLYCKEKKLSISIKNSGEEAIITAINIPEEIPGKIEFTKQNYITHRLNGVKKVCLKQAWIAKNDFNCAGEKDENGNVKSEGMPVLQPAWRAFVGFEPNVELKKMEE